MTEAEVLAAVTIPTGYVFSHWEGVRAVRIPFPDSFNPVWRDYNFLTAPDSTFEASDRVGYLWRPIGVFYRSDGYRDSAYDPASFIYLVIRALSPTDLLLK